MFSRKSHLLCGPYLEKETDLLLIETNLAEAAGSLIKNKIETNIHITAQQNTHLAENSKPHGLQNQDGENQKNQ